MVTFRDSVETKKVTSQNYICMITSAKLILEPLVLNFSYLILNWATVKQYLCC